jgi:hypothetical protein
MDVEFRAKGWLGCAAVLLSAISPGCLAQQAAPVQPPTGLGCVLQFQDHYVCNREAFQSRLARAQTVQVSVARMELFAEKQMTELVQSLGKTEVVKGGKPDLIFELSSIDRTGRIDFGPADFALATLTVYEPVRGGRRRIWVETFDGQEDRPWPGTVIDLIRQFKHDALQQ